MTSAVNYLEGYLRKCIGNLIIAHLTNVFFLNLLIYTNMKTKALAINTMALRAGAILALLMCAAMGML
jgi:hypothetical protein